MRIVFLRVDISENQQAVEIARKHIKLLLFSRIYLDINPKPFYTCRFYKKCSMMSR